MRPRPPPDYLAGYPPDLVASVRRLIEQDSLGTALLRKYPLAHAVRTDKALYDYVQGLKGEFMRNVGPLGKVAFDSKLRDLRSALGTHTSISRVQGGKLKAKREIHVATVFKESAHDKAFYQLCCHMEPEYHQLEFDLRAYLSHLAAGGRALWSATPGAGAFFDKVE